MDFKQQRLSDNNLACQVIDRNILARELELIDTTWFGYRFMSPWQRTQLFEKSYSAARTKALAGRTSTAQAAAMKPYSVDWTKQSRELTKLWKARQRADELCLPYDELCRKAFEFTELADRKNVCLPEQLIPDWHNKNQIEFKQLWREHIYGGIEEERWLAFTRLDDAATPFRREHFKGLKAQTGMHEYLIEERKRQSKSFEQFILQYNCKKRLLNREAIEKILLQSNNPKRHFDLTKLAVDNWKQAGQPYSAPVRNKTSVCLLQGCYGLMHCYDKQSDCSVCPLQQACKEASEQCEFETCGAIGGVDPVTELKRMKAAERKRRSRRKIAARKDPAMRQMLELVEKAANKYGREKTVS
ncbi:MULTISPECIES: hypothetical protein [unclassified Brucella]|uniref:hypothetical protein n=1 Tax=unclassified Brucella TaxID=2632610 RepID=UPI00217CD6CD|nr:MULTISPECIES: hypothetical protein [unclassified Brucella]UWF66293.1 hypothetical protein NYO63_08735 [Brucella sp. 1315]UWF69416.1 hypothetical protein NYO65_08730 [Brucella sp. 2594]